MKDPSTLVDQVVRRLRQDILSGKFHRGSRLPAERELADTFNVSRVTIRTAISRLSQLGFVKTVPQSGTFVNDYLQNASLDLLIDIIKNSEEVDSEILIALLDLRRIVEVHAAGRAVLRMEDGDIAELKALVTDMDTLVKDTDDLVDRVYRFHMAIILFSGNPVLQVLFNSIESLYRFYLTYFYKIPGKAAGIKPCYNRFIRAAEMRDDRYASHVMEELLGYGETAIKEAINTSSPIQMPPKGG